MVSRLTDDFCHRISWLTYANRMGPLPICTSRCFAIAITACTSVVHTDLPIAPICSPLCLADGRHLVCHPLFATRDDTNHPLRSTALRPTPVDNGDLGSAEYPSGEVSGELNR